MVAKLHGDYQSIAIKNTGSELEEQDARMRHVLVESGKRFGMIFVGYIPQTRTNRSDRSWNDHSDASSSRVMDLKEEKGGHPAPD